jgi:Na+/proline symporter
MGLLSLALLQVGGSLQYVYLELGVLIGSAVVPISLAIVWNKTNKVAASLGALGGLTCGMLVWLASSYSLYGVISVSTTGHSLPVLAGDAMSLSIGAILRFF